MERIVYRKTLDVHKNGIQFTLQGFETADKMSRRIEISLMASGDTIDLPLEQITAMMYVTTPSATEPSINACTIKDNNIIYDVLPIVEEGITEMQIKLIETRLEGAQGVLASPKFAVEVLQSNTDESGVPETTFTALENAIARACSLQEKNIIGVELDDDFVFKVNYVDGTSYESDILKELKQSGEVLLSQSYARGGTGVRTGEDTDNSMYYSNVSKSASAEASKSTEESADILEEVRKHGVYTSFSVDFEKGELRYMSPTYDFNVNQENGNLEAEGGEYNPDEVIQGYMQNYREETDEKIETLEKENKNLDIDLSNLKYLGSDDSVIITHHPLFDPGRYLGGSWKIIDKEFAPTSGTDAYVKSIETEYTNVYDESDFISDAQVSYARGGHSVYFRISFKVIKELSLNTTSLFNHLLGSIDYSKVGITGPCFAKNVMGGYRVATGSGFYDYGTFRLFTYDSNNIALSAIFNENMTIPVGAECTAEFIEVSPMDYMLDDACNKFYWRKKSEWED